MLVQPFLHAPELRVKALHRVSGTPLEGAVARRHASTALHVTEISGRGLGREQRVLPQVLREVADEGDVSIFPRDELSCSVNLCMKKITIVAYSAEGFQLFVVVRS